MNGMRRDDVVWIITITLIAVTINPVLKSMGLLPADVRVERLAGDVLHHEDRPIRRGREIMHAAHVGVTDRPRVEQLLAERIEGDRPRRARP